MFSISPCHEGSFSGVLCSACKKALKDAGKPKGALLSGDSAKDPDVSTGIRISAEGKI